ncbi:18114_t:CDS:2, partial [Funneliformis geosporum]
MLNAQERRIINSCQTCRTPIYEGEPIYTSSKSQSSGHARGAYGGKSFGDYQAGGYGGTYGSTHASESGILLVIIATIASAFIFPGLEESGILVGSLALVSILGNLFQPMVDREKYEIKEVRRGFATYLLLRKEVLLANEKNHAWLEGKKAKKTQEDLMMEERAKKIYDKINNTALFFTLKKNEEGKPFGSIGFKEISTELEKLDFHCQK